MWFVDKNKTIEYCQTYYLRLGKDNGFTEIDDASFIVLQVTLDFPWP